MKLILEQWRQYILDESAYKDIIADTPRGVSEEKWGELVNYMREKDPSGKSKYLRWFARHLWSVMIPYNTDALPQKYTDERADEINYKKLDDYAKILQRYHVLLPYIKASPESKRYADIGAVMGLGHLRNLVNEFEAVKNRKDALKKSKMDDADLARAETDVIMDTDMYIIRRPHTTLACQRYSRGTPWCIGADKNNQFLGYMDEGMVTYIIDFHHKELKGHFLKKIAILVHYDSYDPDATIVDDRIYDIQNHTMSIKNFKKEIEDVISGDEFEHIMKELRMDTILHPPIEGGVGSDIGEKFLGDKEWDDDPTTVQSDAYVRDGPIYPNLQEKDYQKDSEKINKDHSRLKKQVLDKGANKETGGGKGHKKTKFKRGKSAPPMGEGK